jgi:hypothetical protein
MRGFQMRRQSEEAPAGGAVGRSVHSLSSMVLFITANGLLGWPGSSRTTVAACVLRSAASTERCVRSDRSTPGTVDHLSYFHLVGHTGWSTRPVADRSCICALCMEHPDIQGVKQD